MYSHSETQEYVLKIWCKLLMTKLVKCAMNSRRKSMDLQIRNTELNWQLDLGVWGREVTKPPLEKEFCAFPLVYRALK